MTFLEPSSGNVTISVILVLASTDNIFSSEIFLIFGIWVVFNRRAGHFGYYEIWILLKPSVLTGFSDTNLAEEERSTALLLPRSRSVGVRG